CPEHFNCKLEKVTQRFIIEYDKLTTKQLTKVPELVNPIMGKTALYLNNQNLTKLPNSTLYGYYNLSELHLANNNFTELHVAQLPPNLTYLDISNNSLQSLDKSVLDFLSNRPGLRLKLAGNPWICECNNDAFVSFVSHNLNNLIEDRRSVKCNLGLIAQLTKTDICGLPNNYIYIVGVGSIISIAVMINVYMCYKKSIMMFLYERNLLVNWITQLEPEANKNKKFDAFLAFSHRNLDMVEEYVEKLENGALEFKLCFYQRNWMVGASISQCILESIDESKRIIILLTKEFTKSPWSRFELRTAIQATSGDSQKRLIVILYPEVEIDSLDSELRTFLKYHTYLQRDDPHFWRKLAYAMPHKQRRQ
ncbi:hypothetical protein KR215_005029, partial [Drosophila sulfurigaster]